MVTTRFGFLVAAVAAALTQLAAHGLRRGGSAKPAREAARPSVEPQPVERTDSPEATTDFVFYTLDDACLPYGSDILHWWFRRPPEVQADIKKGDLV